MIGISGIVPKIDSLKLRQWQQCCPKLSHWQFSEFLKVSQKLPTTFSMKIRHCIAPNWRQTDNTQINHRMMGLLAVAPIKNW